MDKAVLMELAEKHQAKAARANANYQETGIRRYYLEYCRNDDISNALFIAANASEDHDTMVNMRIELSSYAHELKRKREKNEDCAQTIDALILYAQRQGLI